MPDSMYDKLGELLNEAIETGNFFANPQSDSSQKYTETPQKEENKEKQPVFSSESVQKSIHINKQQQSCIVSESSKPKKLIKYAHFSIQKACSLLEITDEMTFEQAKKQYHKKLLRFHPDKNADNEIMNKITREKTAEFINAWNIFEKWYLS